MNSWTTIVVWAAAMLVAAVAGYGQGIGQRGFDQPKYVDIALQKLCARSLESGESASVSGRGYKTYVEFSGMYTDPDSKGGQGSVKYQR